MRLMYITNNEQVARFAEKVGVDWIFVDLEYIGKFERQGHLDTVISGHGIEDVRKIKNILTKSQLLVRVNPIHKESKTEISRVLEDGADIVMLPYFKTSTEVETFLEYVGGKAQTCLLLETPAAVEDVDKIIDIRGIDYIHVGLNDLHLGYSMKFMFELLADGTVERLCKKFYEKGLKYGFGGIARLGSGRLDPRLILSEHYRLGSSQVILSRMFCDLKKEKNLVKVAKVFENGVRELRDCCQDLQGKEQSFYENNRGQLVRRVKRIAGQ